MGEFNGKFGSLEFILAAGDTSRGRKRRAKGEVIKREVTDDFF